MGTKRKIIVSREGEKIYDSGGTFSTEAEIFAAGTWNGDSYTTGDLDSMVEAFDCLKSKFRPPIKLGHDYKGPGPEQPALGYVDKLKRVGNKLIATITNIPKVIKEAVEKGLYLKRSCEVFWNYEDDEGKKYPRVLKAVALLGASIPAVINLKDIEKFFGNYQGGEKQMAGDLRIYEFAPATKSYDEQWAEYKTTGKLFQKQEIKTGVNLISQEIDAEIAMYNLQHPELKLSYYDAFKRVLSLNQNLKARYYKELGKKGVV